MSIQGENANSKLAQLFTLRSLIGLIVVLVLSLELHAALKPQVVIETIEVPKELVERGYSGKVVAQLLKDQLVAIESHLRESASTEQTVGAHKKRSYRPKTKHSGFSLNTTITQTDFQLPVVGISMRAFSDWIVARTIGSPPKISGEIIVDKSVGEIRMSMRVGVTPVIGQPASADLWDMDALINQAAETLLPQMVAELEGVSASDDKSDEHFRMFNDMAQELADKGLWTSATVAYKLADIQGRALEPDPRDFWFHNSRGFAHEIAEEFTYAIESYRRAHDTGNEADSEKSLAAFNLATTYLQLGAFERAERLLTNLESSYLDQRYIFRELANALARQNKFDQANKYYEKAVTLGDVDSYDWKSWAEALMEQNRYEESAEKFALAVELDPQNASLYEAWAVALLFALQSEEAIDKIHEAFELDPNDPSILVTWSEILLQLNQPMPALELIESALDLNERHAGAYSAWCWALVELNEYEAAKEKCKEATQIDPDLEFAWSGWGDVLALMGSYGEAIAMYEQARSDAGISPYAAAELGLTLSRLNRFDEALAWLQETIERQPYNGHAWNRMSEVLIEMNRYDEAIGAARRSLEIDPLNPSAHNNIGWALLEKGQYEGAREQNMRALELSNHDLWARIDLGNSLAGDGEFEEAYGHYRLAVEEDPYFAYSFSEWGRALASEGRDEAAIKLYYRALSLDPYLHDARVNLARSYLNLGDLQEALRIAAEVHAKDPHNSDALVVWGEVLHKMGNTADAIDKLREATVVNCYNEDAYLRAAEIWEVNGEADKAGIAYLWAVKVDSEGVDGSEARRKLSLLTSPEARTSLWTEGQVKGVENNFCYPLPGRESASTVKTQTTDG